MLGEGQAGMQQKAAAENTPPPPPPPRTGLFKFIDPCLSLKSLLVTQHETARCRHRAMGEQVRGA